MPLFLLGREPVLPVLHFYPVRRQASFAEIKVPNASAYTHALEFCRNGYVALAAVGRKCVSEIIDAP